MPSNSREQRAIRIILINMMLEMHTIVRGRGQPVEESVVMMAVRLGQYQGKPMDVSAIASITTLPRTSVIRHIGVLRKKGLVKSDKIGRRVVQYIPLGPEQAVFTTFYEEAERIMRRVCGELSNLDTLPVDTPDASPYQGLRKGNNNRKLG